LLARIDVERELTKEQVHDALARMAADNYRAAGDSA
jgi:hypothetical protein